MTAAIMPLDILIYGALALWLVAVIPAAAITALKKLWLLYITGFFTLGLVWLVGAASLAEPDSWWATRFYDEQKRERAAHPERYPRSRRAGTAAAVGSILLSMIVLGLFAAYPSPILGVDGRSLEYSVAGPSILGAKPCHNVGEDTWTCHRWDNGGSSVVDYRVEVDNLGCWTAVRVRASSERSPKSLSGCITIRDHIRFFDRLFGLAMRAHWRG